MSANNEYLIVVGNCLLYFFTLCFLKKKYGWKDLSTILVLFYTISSISSLLYYLTPVFKYSFTYVEGKPFKIEAFLYLYIINMMLCLPFRGMNKFSMKENHNKGLFLLNIFAFIGVLVLLLTRIGVSGNIFSLSNFFDRREITYDQGVFVGNKIASLSSMLFNELPVFMIIIALYRLFVQKVKSKLIKWSIFVYIFNAISLVLLYASRGGVVVIILEIFLIYLIFRPYIDQRYKKYILMISSIVFVLLLAIFAIITIERFSYKSVSHDEYSIQRYAGEPMLNFATLMYDNTTGCALGYKSFPLFRRLIGLDYYGMYGTNKYDNLVPLDKIHPTYNWVFYQLAGDLYLNWGKWGTLIISFLFYLFIRKKRKKNVFSIFDVFIIFTSCIYIIYGIFFPLYRSEAGNMLLIYYLFSYFLFKNIYGRI